MPVRFEVVLPKRVKPQPLPHIVPGGDCGACVLGGLLGLEPADVYKRFEIDVPKTTISYHEMYSVLWNAQGRELDRIITDIAEWRGGSHVDVVRTWGSPSWTQAQGWFSYLRMGLDAGYYAIANVNHAKAGPWQAPDHWVLLCGAREVWPEASGGIDHQVLVSCSSRTTPDEEWVDVHEFLEKRGGFNLYFARPVTR
jgi:hypothetical protein